MAEIAATARMSPDEARKIAELLAARLELLAVLFDGSLLRRLTVRMTETGHLREIYQATVEQLLSREG